LVPAQPSKHLNFGPSDAQSGSVRHVFEHALPTELHPPSLTTARSRHSPEVHSLPEEQVALAGLPLVLLLHAATARRLSRIRLGAFIGTPA
jgi:hypothetical protein